MRQLLALILILPLPVLAQVVIEGILSASDPILAAGEHYRLHTLEAYRALGESFPLAPGMRYALQEGRYICMGTVQVYLYSTPGAGGYLYPQYMDSYQEVARFHLAAGGRYGPEGSEHRYSYDPASGALYWLEGEFAGRSSSYRDGALRIGDWSCTRA